MNVFTLILGSFVLFYILCKLSRGNGFETASNGAMAFARNKYSFSPRA